MRTVKELSKEELDELRDTYFFKVDTPREKYNYSPKEVPDKVLFKEYEGVSFVSDDFWCNLKN